MNIEILRRLEVGAVERRLENVYDSSCRSRFGVTLCFRPKYRAGNHHFTSRPSAVRLHQQSASQMHVWLCGLWIRRAISMCRFYAVHVRRGLTSGGLATVERMFSGECTCELCGRVYRYDYRRGHTKKQCNSCRSNKFRLQRRNKERLVELRGGRCEICGYSRCLRALTFHHLDPATKRFHLAGAPTRRWEELVAEAERCALLCENCHREVELGISAVPQAVRSRIEAFLQGVERRERRPPGRPRLS